MVIRFYCPRWGSESLSWDDFCRKVKEAGYDGVETPLPVGNRTETDLILGVLRDHRLELIAQTPDQPASSPEEHARQYRTNLEWLAAVRPRFINSQTGRDWFSFEDNRAILAVASGVSLQTGVAVNHETHRGKFSFAAMLTVPYLETDPALRLTADFSHWCNVSESLLVHQAQSVAKAIEHVHHIHARVGHPQGAQVSDPRAPEWKEAFEAHLAWWDRIVARHRAAGAKEFTVTPEFGSPPYMPTLPFTGQPVTSQWDVNVFMMELLRERWKSVSAKESR